MMTGNVAQLVYRNISATVALAPGPGCRVYYGCQLSLITSWTQSLYDSEHHDIEREIRFIINKGIMI